MMGQAQAQINHENNSDNIVQATMSDPGRFDELARQFEDVLQRAKRLGLDVLEEPIMQTASSLKDLNSPHVSVSTKQKLLGASCHCEKLINSDEFNCNICDDKCHSDASSWENIISIGSDEEQSVNSLSNDNHGMRQIASLCEGKCPSNVLPCWGCHSTKVKGNDYEEVGATSSEDDPTTRSQEEIVIVEASKSSSSKSASERMPSASVSLRALDTSSTINHGLMTIKKQDIKNELICPCGCGNYLEGEFKVCPCGCGQIVEIIDESKDNSVTGQYCECAGDTGSRNLSNFTINTDNNSALELLQMKCRIKDGMIAVLAEELRNTANVDQIIENLATPCLPHTAIDFDRSILHDYLKRQSLSELHSEEQLMQGDLVLPPRNFRVVRPILNSLYVAWDLPHELCNIRGYEILVNGVVTSRVRSATRSQAILTSIDLTRPTILTLYSVATNGHISEPLTITFPNRKYE